MPTSLDNFVRSVLAVDATAADATLVLAKAAPPLRDPPAASAGAPGSIVLQDSPSAPAKIEVIKYTGRTISGTQVTLTGVTRGQEGTTAQAWTAGTPTFQGWTAAVLADIQANKLDVTGTAAAALTAARLTTPRNFSLAGVVNAAAVPFDGTVDLALNTTIPNNALTFAMVNGLQAALDGKVSKIGDTMSGALHTPSLLVGPNATSGYPLDVDVGSGAGRVLMRYTNGINIDGVNPANNAYVGLQTSSPWLFVAGFTSAGKAVFNTDDNTFTSTAPLRFTGMGANGNIFIHGLNGSGDDIANIHRNNANSNYTLTMNGSVTTNSTDTGALYVSNGGNIRLGSSSGLAKFLRTNPSNANLEIVNNAYNAVVSWMQDNGIWVAPDFQATSDARVKDDVQLLTRGMDALKKMPPREYIKGGRPEVGYLAQEAMRVIPEAVSSGHQDGLLRLSYGQVTALIGSALLELEQRVARLEASR